MKFPRPLLVWCCLWVLFIAVSHSNTGSSMGLFLVCYGITVIWGLVWFIRLLVHAWRARRGIAPEDRGCAFWAIEPLTLVLAILIAMSGVPSYLRFAASQSALASYVQRARDADRENHWVGLYAVRETEVLPGGVVRFITSESGFDDAGFAFALRSAPPVIGEDSYTKLPFADGWYHWHRSW